MRALFHMMILSLFFLVSTANSQQPDPGGNVKTILANLRADLGNMENEYRDRTVSGRFQVVRLNSEIARLELLKAKTETEYEIERKNMRKDTEVRLPGEIQSLVDQLRVLQHAPVEAPPPNALPDTHLKFGEYTANLEASKAVLRGEITRKGVELVEARKAERNREAEMIELVAELQRGINNAIDRRAIELSRIILEKHQHDRDVEGVEEKIAILEEIITDREAAVEEFIAAMGAGGLIDPTRQALLAKALRERLPGVVGGADDFGPAEPFSEAPDDPGDHAGRTPGGGDTVQPATLNFVGTFDITYTETFSSGGALETFSGTLTIDQNGNLVGATIENEIVTSFSGQVTGDSMSVAIDSLDGGVAAETDFVVTINGNSLSGTFEADDVAGPNSEDGNVTGTKR